MSEHYTLYMLNQGIRGSKTGFMYASISSKLMKNNIENNNTL